MKLPCRIVVALGCFGIGCATGRARVGETEKQCAERYGTPIGKDKEESLQVYRKGDFTVAAHFYEGVCDLIVFYKPKEGIRGQANELTENERDILLKANGGDREWKKKGDGRRDDCFRNGGR